MTYTNWEEIKLGELCELITSGSREWSKYYSTEGSLFVRTENIKTNQLAPAEEIARVNLPGNVEGTRTLIQGGDLLITITGANVGKCAIVENLQETAYVSQSVALVRLTDKRLNSFIHKQLLSPSEGHAGKTKLQDLAYGIGRPVLSLKDIRNLQVSIPPLGEQRRIADKLDTTLAAIEACKQKLNNAAETIQRFRQSVLAAAVSGELTREWREERGVDRSDWKSTTFGKVCSQITVGFVGKMSDQYKESGIPFLRSMNIKPFRLKEDGILYISSEFHEKIIKSRLLPGDLAVVRTGEPGQCCVIPDSLPEANCSDLVVLRPGEQLFAEFGAIAINSSSVRNFVNSEKVGVAQAHFNVGSMKITPLELPSMEEQTAISELVADFQRKADEIQDAINKNQEILINLTKSLLAKAFRGELVPQDPNDEPASVLLARIKAQREEEIATKKPARRSRKKKADAAQLVIPEGIADNHLAKVLEECGALSQRALLAASELEPGVFQLQLSKELGAGGLKQVGDEGTVAYVDAAWEEEK